MEKYSHLLGLGAVIGAVAGMAIGVATHQPVVWLALGVGVGLAIGVALRDRKQSQCASIEQKSLRD